MYKDEKVVANTSKKKSKKDDGTLVIDLHADEVLETTAGMNSADILHYQMDIFKKTMEEYKKRRDRKLSLFMERAKVCCARLSFMS